MKSTTLAKEAPLKWRSFGEFSVHYAQGAAVINNRCTRQWVSTQTDSDRWFNSYQYFLFRRCLYGLEVYSQEELRYISSQKKKRINHVHTRAREVLNLYRQRMLIVKTNEILRTFLGNSRTIRTLIVEHIEPDAEFDCSISFESLGINRLMIARELVSNKCLPLNFFELTLEDDPRMVRLKAPQEPLDQL